MNRKGNSGKSYMILFLLCTTFKRVRKQIILCKVPAHMGIKESEKAAKQAIDMPGMIRDDQG